MAGHSIPSKAELVEFTQQHPVWAAAQAAEQRLQVRGGHAGERRT